MILAITENDAVREYQQLRDLIGTRIAGLVISPTTHLLDDTRRLLTGLPVVELHRVSGIDTPSVLSDDEQALTDSVLHLAALGHTDITYLGTPGNCPTGYPAARHPARLGRPAYTPTGSLPFPAGGANSGERQGRDQGAAQRLPPVHRAGGRRRLAVGRRRRRRCAPHSRQAPKDLSLVVYGNPAWFVLADPPLSLLSPYTRAGTAARLLLSALDARARIPVPGPDPQPAVLGVAGSTGPPPGAWPCFRAAVPAASSVPTPTKESFVTDSALAGLRVIDTATLPGGASVATGWPRGRGGDQGRAARRR